MEDKTDQVDSQLARQAVQWLMRLERANPRERAEFMDWLKESPKHVREVLLQLMLEDSLRRLGVQIVPSHRIGVR